MTQETFDRATKLASKIESYNTMLITLGNYEEIEVRSKKKKGLPNRLLILKADETNDDSRCLVIMDGFIAELMFKIRECIYNCKNELDSL